VLGFHSHEGMVGGRKVFTWGAAEGVGSLRSLGLATEEGIEL
jgi:hypothetical protein